MQLDRENDKLRSEMTLSRTTDKAAVESLQQLLNASRKDIERYRITAKQGEEEIIKLRHRIDEMQTQLADERTNAARHETLAKEYGVQIQELRNRLTDSRFVQVSNKNTSDDRFTSL